MTETSRLADPNYLRFQYADDQKLRVRIETHERYSENPLPFRRWLTEVVAARPGQGLLACEGRWRPHRVYENDAESDNGDGDT